MTYFNRPIMTTKGKKRTIQFQCDGKKLIRLIGIDFKEEDVFRQLVIPGFFETSGPSGNKIKYKINSISSYVINYNYGFLLSSAVDDVNSINNHKIKEFVIDSGITSVESNAFLNTNIDNLKILGRNVNIGASAFESSSVKTIIFESTIKDIGPRAFYNCNSLNSLKIPKHCKLIGSETFSNCPNLSELELCDEIDDIGAGAFSGCSKITTFNWPVNSDTIREKCFQNCSELSSIKIKNHCIRIENAFAGTKIKEIDLSGAAQVNIVSLNGSDLKNINFILPYYGYINREDPELPF